jgi:hypothetical protein
MTKLVRGIHGFVDRMIKAPLLFRERGWGEGKFLCSRDHGPSDEFIHIPLFLGEAIVITEPGSTDPGQALLCHYEQRRSRRSEAIPKIAFPDSKVEIAVLR